MDTPLEKMAPPARALAVFMSEISESYYCAGWLIDLEYRLWEEIQGGAKEPGKWEVSPGEKETLKWLSEACGGWIRYGEEGEEFIALGEWQELYARKQAQAKSLDGG